MILSRISGNFGGLLGLCFGFSIINIIEIAYFFTIKLYQNISKENDSSRHNVIPVYCQWESNEEKMIRAMYVNDFKKMNISTTATQITQINQRYLQSNRTKRMEIKVKVSGVRIKISLHTD